MNWWIPRLSGLVSVALLVLTSKGSAQEADPVMAKYKTRLNQAVERGLVYLAKQQLDANAAQALGRQELIGSFAEPQAPGDTGITSLAVLAFLANGHLPGLGRYGDVINRGIDYILGQQLENGLLICADPRGRTSGLMYSHSISTLLLCEVSGMVDRKRQQRIDEVLPKAVLLLLQAQKVPKSEDNEGGWRYHPGTTESDLSLTGWSVMALRASKMNGAAIPDPYIEKAVSYILKCRHQSGGFTYYPKNGKPTPSMTGVALLCLELCGEHGREELKLAGDYILKNPPQMKNQNGVPEIHRYYAYYYCGQAMFQLGGKYWLEFAPLAFDALLEDQQNDGRWAYPEKVFQYNTSYPTSMAVLTLTVPARQLPIYQRDE